jgi:hypothetical protein
MGLDMRPMGKPKNGYEDKFIELYNLISGKTKQNIGLVGKLKGKKEKTKDELLQEWFEIQIPSYETIKAPMVGRDQEANEWIKNKYRQSDHLISEEEFIEKARGYYVIELAKEKDGVPMYVAIGQDENVFRGQFLNDCVDIIGENLVAEAWNTKLANEALDYGIRLMGKADEIAKVNNLEYLRSQRNPPNSDETKLDWKLHILFSVAKWLIFYGKNGHGYEADY